MDFAWINFLRSVMLEFGDFIEAAWGWVSKIVPTINAIGISLITYYTFRLTVFPKKLRFVDLRENFSSFGGDSLEITLENRSLCPCVIKNVDIILDGYSIAIFRGECTVEGFKTVKIVTEPYTEIDCDNGKIDIDGSSIDRMALLIKTTRGFQHIKYERISKFAYWLNSKKESKYKPTTVYRKMFNGKIVVPDIKYAISFIDGNGELQTIFVHKSGVMSDALFGYNGLTKEIMESEISLKKHFDNEFKTRGLSYSIHLFKEAESNLLEEHSN